MKIIQFENEPAKTKFAPVFQFDIFEDDADVKNIKDIVLSKELEVINNNPYTHDWNTGLGANSMTSRSNCYNLLDWEEAFYMREVIRTAHDNFITTLDNTAWEDTLYVQCWANVLRKGEKLKQHQHWTSEYTYLGGHICLGNYDTKTHYVNPYTRQTYPSDNCEGKITLFPNWMEHYTDPYDGDDVRVSIAFDIITEVVYNEDIFRQMKNHWVRL